jgi:hypothetical protein
MNTDEVAKRNSFEKTFSKLDFNDLKLQNMALRTEDGCYHYLHRYNNNVYSWCFFNNTWSLSNKINLMRLFE